jgi:hypothetical protein
VHVLCQKLGEMIFLSIKKNSKRLTIFSQEIAHWVNCSSLTTLVLVGVPANYARLASFWSDLALDWHQYPMIS